MNTKLTLNIDEKIAERAKIVAEERGESISDMFENFIKNLTSKNTRKKIANKKDEKNPSIVDRMLNRIEKNRKEKDFNNADLKAEKLKRLEEKYW